MRNFNKNGAIYSDDPSAVEKLKNKLSELEKQRERYKQENKELRKAGKEVHPAWMLQNLGQNIRRIKGRISQIEKENTLRANGGDCRLDYDDVGITYFENCNLNRVQLLFEEKPAEETCRMLKANGFRYAPSEEAWQRHLNDAGRYSAKRVIKRLREKKTA